MTKGQSTTLCTSIHQPSGSCHSAQQLLASSLSFYLRMYICTLSESQVYEALHVTQLPLRTRRHLPLSHRGAKSKLQWQTLQHLLDVLPGWRYQNCVVTEHGRILVSHNTVKGIACETRSEPSPSRRPWLYDRHQEQKELVYSHFWMSEKPSHCVCVFAVRTIEQ